MLGAVYGRVSTYIQREKNTIETQKKENIRYAEYEKIRIYKEYYDDGVSSSYPLHKRPGGFELLRDARAKKFDCIIVYKLDRLGRSAFEILQVIKLLEKLGIKLISVSEKLDTGTAIGRMMIVIIAAFAELEKETIRERTIAGSRRLAREGKNTTGNPAFGYKIVDGYWVIVKENATIVRLIYKYYRSGLSAYKVAVKLNKLYPAPKGGKWIPATINNIIKNEDYAGLHVYGRNRNVNEDGKVRTVPADKANWIVIKIPAIVSRKVWEAAQRQRKENATNSKRNAIRVYLLSSRIKCGVCGNSYMGQTKHYNGKKYIYYSCSSASRRMPCGTPSIRAEHLEDYIWNEVAGFIRNPKSVIEKVMARLASTDKSHSEIEEEISLLDQQLKEAEKFKEGLVTAIGRRVMDDEDAKPQMEMTKESIVALKIERERLLEREGNILRHKDSLNKVESVLSRLSERVDKADDETKAMVIRRLVEKVVIEPDMEDARKPPRAVVHYLFNYNYNGSPL
jgi:site-specific DNA recombinase